MQGSREESLPALRALWRGTRSRGPPPQGAATATENWFPSVERGGLLYVWMGEGGGKLGNCACTWGDTGGGGVQVQVHYPLAGG